DVERREAGVLEARGDLEQQRALADARLAADEYQRPGHDSPADHEVELVQAGSPACALLSGDLGEPARRRAGGAIAPHGRRPPRVLAAARPRARRWLFRKRVPGAASGALPLPPRRLVSTLGAEERGLDPGHTG